MVTSSGFLWQFRFWSLPVLFKLLLRRHDFRFQSSRRRKTDPICHVFLRPQKAVCFGNSSPWKQTRPRHPLFSSKLSPGNSITEFSGFYGLIIVLPACLSAVGANEPVVTLNELWVLMLCAPVFIFTSGSSALLGRPRCGLSIWLSLLVIFNTLFWVYWCQIVFTRKRKKHENTRSAIFVWYENVRRRLLGVQSINTEITSLKSTFVIILVMSRSMMAVRPSVWHNGSIMARRFICTTMRYSDVWLCWTEGEVPRLEDLTKKKFGVQKKSNIKIGDYWF